MGQRITYTSIDPEDFQRLRQQWLDLKEEDGLRAPVDAKVTKEAKADAGPQFKLPASTLLDQDSDALVAKSRKQTGFWSSFSLFGKPKEAAAGVSPLEQGPPMVTMQELLEAEADERLETGPRLLRDVYHNPKDTYTFRTIPKEKWVADLDRFDPDINEALRGLFLTLDKIFSFTRRAIAEGKKVTDYDAQLNHRTNELNETAAGLDYSRGQALLRDAVWYWNSLNTKFRQTFEAPENQGRFLVERNHFALMTEQMRALQEVLGMEGLADSRLRDIAKEAARKGQAKALEDTGQLKLQNQDATLTQEEEALDAASNQAVELLTDEDKALEEERARLEAVKKELEAEKARLDRLSKTLAQDKQGLTDLQSDIENAGTENTKAKRELGEALDRHEKDLEALARARKTYDTDKASLDRARTEFDAAKSRIEEELKAKEIQLAAERKALEEAKAALKAQQAEFEESKATARPAEAEEIDPVRQAQIEVISEAVGNLPASLEGASLYKVHKEPGASRLVVLVEQEADELLPRDDADYSKEEYPQRNASLDLYEQVIKAIKPGPENGGPLMKGRPLAYYHSFASSGDMVMGQRSEFLRLMGSANQKGIEDAQFTINHIAESMIEHPTLQDYYMKDLEKAEAELMELRRYSATAASFMHQSKIVQAMYGATMEPSSLPEVFDLLVERLLDDELMPLDVYQKLKGSATCHYSDKRTFEKVAGGQLWRYPDLNTLYESLKIKALLGQMSDRANPNYKDPELVTFVTMPFSEIVAEDGKTGAEAFAQQVDEFNEQFTGEKFSYVIMSAKGKEKSVASSESVAPVPEALSEKIPAHPAPPTAPAAAKKPVEQVAVEEQQPVRRRGRGSNKSSEEKGKPSRPSRGSRTGGAFFGGVTKGSRKPKQGS